VITRRGTLPAGSGLHARPAAELVAAVAAAGQPVRIARAGGVPIAATSLLRVLGLGIHGGESIELSIDTPADQESARRLLDELLVLLGASQPADDHEAGRRLVGVSACAGAAVGIVMRMADRPVLPQAGSDTTDPETDAASAVSALMRVADDLRRRAAHSSGSARAVLEAQARIADDAALHDAVSMRARAGSSAGRAVTEAIEPFRDAISRAGGDLAERAADVDDVRDRAVAICLGLPLPGLPDPDHPYVLVADDLAAADAALLDPERVLAVITVRGGPTSHTAILAREVGIPAVVACPDAASLVSGVRVAVFATDGTVVVAPAAGEVAAVERQRRHRPRTAATSDAATADGYRVPLLANVGTPERAVAARLAGAEGVGLLRTEFCFEGRAAAPSVAEQVAAYRSVAQTFAGARVVIRLLDAGADKPLAYLQAEHDPNPALGIRGLRALRAAPVILADQLEAIAAVARAGDAEIWVMAPMVATRDETAWFAATARRAGVPTVGVMIEVPAAALAAADLLASVDFASIGTNDLLQYLFAADRTLPQLAALQDPWHPTLLRLVESTATAGASTGRPVAVCGEAASDPHLALVLVGLGVSSLSMPAGSLTAVRDLLAGVTLDDCRRLSQRALATGDGREARAAVVSAITPAGRQPGHRRPGTP
jgi:phosphoenolpyruvate-protein phosphotransferase (PTS system enzyme I)